MSLTDIRLPLYIDADNVTLETIDAISKLYTYKYENHPKFKEPNIKNVRKWNFVDEMPLMTPGDIDNFFSDELLFAFMQLKPFAYETLKELSESGKFDIAFCSLGTSGNIASKTKYLEREFPFIKTHYMIVKNYGSDIRMKKDRIVQDGVLLDDHQGNLNGSALYDVLFQDNGVTEWNKDFKGKYIVKGWLEFEELAYKLHDDYLDRMWK